MLQIHLRSPLSSRQQHLLVRYLDAPQTLTRGEWKIVWTTMDELHQSRVVVDWKTYTFSQFYRTFIDEVHASAFLAAVWESEQPEMVGRSLQTATAKLLRQQFHTRGWYDSAQPDTRWLLIYCAYWWKSFSTGYIFEIAVLKDLQRRGIPFQARDLQRQEDRFAPVDLHIRGWDGDVKSSTYFLFVARSYPLIYSFYITRLYDEVARRYDWIVLLSETLWEQLNGEVSPTTFDHVEECLARPVRFILHGYTFIALAYAEWTARLRQVWFGGDSNGKQND